MALDNKVKNNGGAGSHNSRWMTRAEVKSGARRGRRNDDRVEVEPEYEPRFVTKEQLGKLYDLYHLASTALAGSRPSRADRIRWACKAIREEYPEVSETGAYKDLTADMDSKVSF